MINPYESPQTDSFTAPQHSESRPRALGLQAGTSFLALAIGNQAVIFWSVIWADSPWRFRDYSPMFIGLSIPLTILAIGATLFCSWESRPRLRAPLRLVSAFPMTAISLAIVCFVPSWLFGMTSETVVLPLAAIVILMQAILLAFMCRAVVQSWVAVTACGLLCSVAGAIAGIFQIAVVFNA